MKITDLQTLTQTHFDSGSLAGLGTVVHRMATPGDHLVTILRAENPIQRLSLRVLQATATATPVPTRELRLDLGQALGPLGSVGAQAATAGLELAAEGYMLLHAPQGQEGFAAQLHAPGAEDQPPTFDSRQLGNTDVYATVLLRPGRYSLTNASTGAKGDIRVSYPVISDTPYQPPEPLNVQVTAAGFQPASIELKPAQGLVFHIVNTGARIQIDLVDPDDGPAGRDGLPQPPGPVGRWEKPLRPQSK